MARIVPPSPDRVPVIALRPAPSAASLAATLVAQSPRYTPRAVGWRSALASSAGPALFLLLLAQAFVLQGLAAWGVGIAYILYDTALLAFTARRIAGLRRDPPAPQPAGSGPGLTVIVAAHNEAAVLPVTIAALLGQTDPPDRILIADDGSTDATRETLRERYGLARPATGDISVSPAEPRLAWLRLPRGGKARALNAAMLHVTDAVVLTVDADTLLEPDAIATMRTAFAAEPDLVAATGVLVPICGPRPVQRLFQWFQTYEYVRNFLSRRAWEQVGGLLLISGAFAAFRRDAVLTVGGFDPDCLVEDYELIHRLHRRAHDTGAGWTVRVIGGAVARTDAPSTLPAFLRQRRRWFGGFLQTQHWNRDMVANPRYGRLGTAMLPVKALDTLQPIYGLVAFAILIGLLARGSFPVALSVIGVMLAKVAVDLSFHLWSLGRYRAWTGVTPGGGTAGAVAASLLEPFSFQLLRHLGALWGWFAFLTGRETWARQPRSAIRAGLAAREG